MSQPNDFGQPKKGWFKEQVEIAVKSRRQRPEWLSECYEEQSNDKDD